MTWVSTRSTSEVLATRHYLGPVKRGVAWMDEFGVIVVAAPTARRLPGEWIELVRWCLVRGVENDGSRQWAAFVRGLRKSRPDVTTIVSYSDPSAGHDGALYRACNWWWAPTWHRLRPPPTGNGSWSDGKLEAVKDRWVFALGRDENRVNLLRAKDEAILKRWPWAEYREPGGASFKTFRSIVVRKTA
jgi:hypothetical protein